LPFLGIGQAKRRKEDLVAKLNLKRTKNPAHSTNNPELRTINKLPIFRHTMKKDCAS
jgi:hypothetical protein